MSNEIVRKDGTDSMLTIGPGPISMEGLAPSQVNELRMLAAKKGIDLAADAAQKQMQLQAAMAEVDGTLNAAKRLVASGARGSITATSQTATGSISIKIKKGLF